MKLTLLIASLTWLLCSCTSLTPQQEYQIQDKYMIARENFEQAQDICRKNGGVMMVKQRGTSVYSFRNYEDAKCVKH